MKTQPTLFISHGSPMLALEERSTTVFLRSISADIPRPRAILVASAHFETEEPTLTGHAHPETLHDFSGFPKELYRLRYAAPGDPALAKQVQTILEQAGIPAKIDAVRGLDHGAWNPLLLMYPAADIPVVELSVQPGRDAAWHYRIGRALAPLKREGILIIGTGNLTHNLREAMRGHKQTPEWVTGFADWFAHAIDQQNTERLLGWELLAPYAKQNHPTPEHLLPFFVALGAAGESFKAERLHKDTAMGVLAMDAYRFEESNQHIK